MTGKRFALIALGSVCWGALVSWGFAQGMRFETTPGKAASNYPSSVAKDGKWRLVLLASTECPCTVASVSGLRAAADSHPESAECQVVFVGKVDRNARSYQIAKSIKNCSVVEDSDGHLTRKYGASTSGQAFIYSPTGTLAYQGGLTAGRGVDDPRFAMEVFEAVRVQRVKPFSPPYGCSLEGLIK